MTGANFEPIERHSRGMTFIIECRIPRNGCSQSSVRQDRKLSLARVMSALRVIANSFWSKPNPGNPSLCLSLSQPNEVLSGTLTCGAGGEDSVYFPIGGGQVNGTRGPLGSNFGSDALQSNIGHANYNALELSARHTSGGLEFSAAYTYGNLWTNRPTSARR